MHDFLKKLNALFYAHSNACLHVIKQNKVFITKF